MLHEQGSQTVKNHPNYENGKLKQFSYSGEINHEKKVVVVATYGLRPTQSRK